MQNIYFTNEEIILARKRGFFVRDNISFGTMLLAIPYFLIFHAASIAIMGIPTVFLIEFTRQYGYFWSHIVPFLFSQSVLLYYLFRVFLAYVFQGKSFHCIKMNTNIITIGELSYIKTLESFSEWTRSVKKKNKNISDFLLIILNFIVPIVPLIIIVLFAYYQTKLSIITEYLLPLFLIFFGFYFIGFMAHMIIEYFHPLYAFGNIGEKIQSLTPVISKKSKEIQKNFQSDMNFQVLSDGFDSLSSVFSEIISLVIRLEKVEKGANKGNLFDSEKYINSLRSDIRESLIPLKSFLEKQREQLVESQKDLQKIRVHIGGSDEGSSNLELSSKRGESLLVELTENIGKLDQMIQKMEEEK